MKDAAEQDATEESRVRWDACDDLRIVDEGRILYKGPQYRRCLRGSCNLLVTLGMVHQGGCWCGNRRLGVAFNLTTEERAMLKRGFYPLCDWEMELVQPTIPPGLALGWGEKEWKRRHG